MLFQQTDFRFQHPSKTDLMPMLRALAKLTPPRLSGIFPRRRVFKQLDRARKAGAVWVAAPAGSGKTTLVASYAQERDLNTWWYQVDAGDDDIASFFYYLGLLAQSMAPRRKILPLLTPEYFAGLTTFARNFFREFFDRMKGPSLLVLDNYQEVSADSKLHDVLEAALVEVPHDVTVVILSRAEPPQCFARVRAEGTLTVFGWEDLRLTPPETASICRLRRPARGAALSKSAIDALYRSTQGWVTGVVLLLADRTAAADARVPPQRADNPVVFDYFANEVLQRLDVDTRELLLGTALFVKFTATMAEALTRIAHADKILAGLVQRNFFTTRHVDASAWFTYHPLFREFLLNQARKVYAAPAWKTMCNEAAVLLEQSGQVEDALAVLHESGATGAAVEMVLRHAQALAMQGRAQTLAQWIAALPTAVVEQSGWLQYWLGVAQLAIQPAHARQLFERAYRDFTAHGDRTGILLAFAGFTDANLFSFSNCQAVKPWVDDIERILADGADYPSVAIEERVTLAMYSALFHGYPDNPALAIWARRVETLALRSDDHHFRAQVLALRVVHSVWLGDAVQAFELTQRLAASIRVAPPVVRQAAIMAVTYFDFMTGDFAEARRKIEQGIKFCHESGVYVWLNMLYVTGMAVALCTDDWPSFENYRARILPDLDKLRPADAEVYWYHVLCAANARGDTAALPRTMQLLNEQSASVGMMWSRCASVLALADAARVLRDDAAAERYLAQGQELAAGMNSDLLKLMSNFIESRYWLEHRNEERALPLLKEGMTLARKRNCVNFIAWNSAMMATLCEKALEHGIEVDYVRELIRKRNLVPREPPLHLDNWPWSIKVFTLGRFSVCVGDKPLTTSQRGQASKALILLKALIAFGGREVSQTNLTEALWPDSEGDAARHAFDTTLYRLRKLLGDEQALVLVDAKLTLDPRYCWVDAWTLERLIGAADSQIKTRAPRGKLSLEKILEKVSELYQGAFLSGDADASWSLLRRERIQARVLMFIAELGRFWESNGQWQSAAACYQLGLAIEPSKESFYQALMRVQQQLNQHADALATYERCKKNLHILLGAAPTPATETLRRQLSVR